MRLSDLEPRQTHLTHPWLPVLETPKRGQGSTMGEQDVSHGNAPPPQSRE